MASCVVVFGKKGGIKNVEEQRSTEANTEARRVWVSDSWAAGCQTAGKRMLGKQVKHRKYQEQG